MSDHRDDVATSAATPLARAIASALSASGLIAAVAGSAFSPSASANTYTVVNNNDSGSGSLRDAVNQANSNPGNDIVTFASNVTGTITLTSGSIYIYDGVDIQGPGASVLTIAGSFGNQPPRPSANVAGFSDFVINGGGSGNVGRPASPSAPLAPTPIAFSGVTITGGSANFGGGINAYNATVTVDNCVVTGNTAAYSGGGIFIASYYNYYGGSTASSVTVTNSTISNNTAGYDGGGVATTDSAITIQQSALTGNSAADGGGVFMHNDNQYALTITASTLSGNTAGGGGSYSGGGGVYVRHSSATISNSTIANNPASTDGGGGVTTYFEDSGYYAVSFANSTVSGNSATTGGGIYQTSDGAITLTNSVVAGNTAATDPDMSSSTGSFAAAFSLIGNPGAATITDNGGNLMNVAAQLGALANNGGPTQTMQPLAGSPLIDAGDPAFSGLTNDQRGAGFPRIVNGRVDIGAVEGGAAVAAAVTPSPGLGLGGKLGLGALLGLAGLAVARRRRNLGGAAGLLLAAALSVSAPNLAQAAQGHATKQREAVTITSYTVNGKIATIVLSNGQTLSAKKWQIRLLDRRSNAKSRQVQDPASIASGTPAAVSFETGKKGGASHVRIRLADTLEQAQAMIARKPKP